MGAHLAGQGLEAGGHQEDQAEVHQVLDSSENLGAGSDKEECVKSGLEKLIKSWSGPAGATQTGSRAAARGQSSLHAPAAQATIRTATPLYK